MRGDGCLTHHCVGHLGLSGRMDEITGYLANEVEVLPGSPGSLESLGGVCMEKVMLDVPALWADHHVLRVRDVLVGLGGVESVYASAAWKQVLVTFDPDQVNPAEIEQCLADAGYPVGEGGPPILVQSDAIQRDPQWGVLGFRATETNRADLELSGEFRRY